MIYRKKRRITKTAKGYRLKNSTHKLIEKIQSMINGSKDTVISRSLKLYYKQIINSSKDIKKINIKIK